jgi:hypothetical protein
VISDKFGGFRDDAQLDKCAAGAQLSRARTGHTDVIRIPVDPVTNCDVLPQKKRSHIVTLFITAGELCL